MEITILALALTYLYSRFSAITEANLFRIHGADRPGLLPAFLKELGLVILVMSLANTAALLVAHYLWRIHLRRVLGDFCGRLSLVTALDLRPHHDKIRFRHPLVATAEQWRQREAARVAALGVEIGRLEAPGPDAESRSQLLRRLRRCKQLLEED
ncbi:hypothetical protein [Motiliproteus sp. SC1-56]|uniref:hypothetical protein n=1 Tax=Motiliproteus sp. SC1-56 TaxID=2799565 RepID=UPI001A9018E5|nr:hypothetical protein [Motiliproteus sp. SC1-56]